MHKDNKGTVTLHVLGDIALNGLYCDPRYHTAFVESWQDLAASLGPCDLRTANLETPLWGDGRVHLEKSPAIFTTSQAAQSLKTMGIDVAIMANNHVYDCLEVGVENTLEFLRVNGIDALGAGLSHKAASTPIVVQCNGLRLGLLAYVDAATKPRVPTSAGAAINNLDKDRMLDDIAKLRQDTDAVIVNVHWGNEYVRYPLPWMRRLARSAISAGATIIAGHHPHCLQGQERWKHGHIFYSLGNFVFGGLPGREQNPWPKLCRQTAVGRCVISKEGVVEADLLPLVQSGFTLHSDDTPTRRATQARLDRSLQLGDKQFERRVAREIWTQWTVRAPYQFVRSSGGPIKALMRLKLKHIKLGVRILGRGTRARVGNPAAENCNPPSVKARSSGAYSEDVGR